MCAHPNKDRYMQKCNVRKVNFSCVYSVYILKPVLSGWNLSTKHRCISVRLVSEEVLKHWILTILIFHIIVSMTRIFHWFFMWKMDPMSGFDIRLVFTLPPKDSYFSTKDEYTSEITFLALNPWIYAHCFTKYSQEYYAHCSF